MADFQIASGLHTSYMWHVYMPAFCVGTNRLYTVGLNPDYEIMVYRTLIDGTPDGSVNLGYTGMADFHVHPAILIDPIDSKPCVICSGRHINVAPSIWKAASIDGLDFGTRSFFPTASGLFVDNGVNYFAPSFLADGTLVAFSRRNRLASPTRTAVSMCKTNPVTRTAAGFTSGASWSHLANPLTDFKHADMTSSPYTNFAGVSGGFRSSNEIAVPINFYLVEADTVGPSLHWGAATLVSRDGGNTFTHSDGSQATLPVPYTKTHPHVTYKDCAVYTGTASFDQSGNVVRTIAAAVDDPANDLGGYLSGGFLVQRFVDGTVENHWLCPVDEGSACAAAPRFLIKDGWFYMVSRRSVPGGAGNCIDRTKDWINWESVQYDSIGSFILPILELVDDEIIVAYASSSGTIRVGTDIESLFAISYDVAPFIDIVTSEYYDLAPHISLNQTAFDLSPYILGDHTSPLFMGAGF